MAFGGKSAWRKAGLAVMIAAGGAGLVWLSTPWSLATLKTRNPATTRMMEFRRQQARAHHRSYQVRQRWMALSRISPWLQKAVLIAEDDTFYEHGALDFSGLWESLKTNWRRKRYAQGGSTVTQQVAKNLFLSPRKFLLRKIKEAVLAVRLERILS
jgi:monofunctional biosynthetic peptidoglycan transglycosylase